jgi:hypothetical protein
MGPELWQDSLKASWGELDGKDKQACLTFKGSPLVPIDIYRNPRNAGAFKHRRRGSLSVSFRGG